MDEQTQKIIAEQMKTLPKDVLAAIISVDYKTKLVEITKRQRLLIDQAGKLEMETTLVMIGLEPLADYVANLQREMGLNTIRAKEVAMDVSENIFKPIRESLQKMNTDLESGEKDEEVRGEETTEPEATKFTNTNEAGLNRDQILNEIENPVPNHPINTAPVLETEVEVKPTQELEIAPKQELKTIPGQEVKDISKNTEVNIFEAKMTGTTITPQQIVNAKPETKLPEITKRSSFDPYREPIN